MFVRAERADGSDATNELTYLFLEAAHRSKAVTNLSVRIHPATPDSLLLEVFTDAGIGTMITLDQGNG